jgi:streptogramin lyase
MIPAIRSRLHAVPGIVETVEAIRITGMVGIVVTLCLLPACASRERTNPFDPGNPATGGTPPLLGALADDGSVRLQWELGGFETVHGVRILRRPEGGDEETAFSFPGIGPGQVIDAGRQNGVALQYRLEVESQPVPLSTTATEATPGGSEPWVGDASGGGVLRLTPDGRGVLYRTEPGRDVLDLAIEEDGSLWVADYGDGAVVQLDRAGRRLEAFDLYGASSVAIDVEDGRLWVGSFDLRAVFLVERDGRVTWTDPGAGLVESVRTAPGGGAWVVSRDGSVRFLRGGAVLFRDTDVAQPVGLAVDDARRAWVADRGDSSVYRYEPGGILRQRSRGRFVSPRDVAPDGRGGAWIADPGRGGLVHLDLSLHEQAFVPCPDVEAAAWDPVNRRLWACCPRPGRVDVFALGADEDGGDARLVASLASGGRPVVVRGNWRR